MNSPQPLKRELLRSLLPALAALLAGLAAITTQSLWMDEGGTVFKALLPSPGDWWSMLLRLRGSDVQMPVYVFLVWVWEKLGASSEYALRAVNLPWLVLGTLALRRVRFWPLVLLTSPFALYYVGEVRPYAMQMAAGAVAAWSLLRVHSGKTGDGGFRGLHAAAGATLLLACGSLTAAVWAAGLWICVLVMRPDWLKRPGFWLRISPWMAAASIMGGYYLWTLVMGYRATSAEGGIMSMLFGFYELLGLAGLGPGRNELRANPAVILSALPVLLPAAGILIAAWIHGVWIWRKSVSQRTLIAVVLGVGAPIALLATVGVVMDFRVLGRHLSPLLPAVLLPIALTLGTADGRKNTWRAVGCLAVAISLTSALGLRFLERHARDDYRRASVIAIDALKKGKRVWWQADMNATRYYAYRQGGMDLVNAIQVLQSDPPTGLMFADMVVINRPDLRFKGSDYQADLRRNFFKPVARFTGFEVWSAE
jgi:hypothetical protein